MKEISLFFLLLLSNGLKSQSLPLSAGSAYPLTGPLYHQYGSNMRRAFTSSYFGYSGGYSVLILGSTSTSYNTPVEGSVTISLGYDPSENPNGSFQGDGREILFRNGASFVTPNAANDGYHLNTLFLKDGKVGLGTATPASTLEIGSGSVFVPDGSAGNPSYSFSGSPGTGFYRAASGVVGMAGDLKITGGISLEGNTYYRKGLTPTYWGYDNQYRVLMIGSPSTTYNSQNGAVTVSINYDPSINANGSFQGDGHELLLRNGTALTTPNAANTSYYLNTLVLKDGNIGLGISSPEEKLSVEGNISANGNITAKKIKVTQTVWADHVFSKNYKLKSLSALESFVLKNKHLPEVPTAKEVEKRGISIGDTQALLLKKIEELTLYIIEQQKQIDVQNKRILKLEKRNK